MVAFNGGMRLTFAEKEKNKGAQKKIEKENPTLGIVVDFCIYCLYEGETDLSG